MEGNYNCLLSLNRAGNFRSMAVSSQLTADIPIVVGYTQKGPIGKAVLVNSPQEYEYVFGGPSHVDSLMVAQNGLSPFFLNQAINAYFRAGGSPCYILAVRHFEGLQKPEVTDLIGLHHGLGVSSLYNLPKATLLCCPEAIGLSTSDYSLLAKAMLRACAMSEGCFALIDSPLALPDHPAHIRLFQESLGSECLYHGAAYYPNLSLQMPDSSTLVMPPSVFIAASYTQVSQNYGIWHTPSGIPIADNVTLLNNVHQQTSSSIDISGCVQPFNILQVDSKKVLTTYTARTLAPGSTFAEMVITQRMMNFIKGAVSLVLEQLSESNHQNTEKEAYTLVSTYLYGLWREGALMGSVAEDAYQVQVNLKKHHMGQAPVMVV